MTESHAYDIVVMGHLSKDINVYEGTEQQVTGGAVVYASAAAVRSGATVLALTKCSREDRHELASITDSGARLQVIDSSATTSIRNVYHSADKEKRTVTLLSRADPFTVGELPDIRTRTFHFAGLFVGELPDTLIPRAAKLGDVALDVQGVLRTEEAGSLLFRDWADKATYLPYIPYLKTDAAEAEIMTGTEDRAQAAEILGQLGSREVMITHNSEVIVWTGGQIYRAPLTPRNLSGRTGRGDTCFGAYLARRLNDDVELSLRFAAALVSLKMETPGVFAGSIEDVRRRMQETS